MIKFDFLKIFHFQLYHFLFTAMLNCFFNIYFFVILFQNPVRMCFPWLPVVVLVVAALLGYYYMKPSDIYLNKHLNSTYDYIIGQYVILLCTLCRLFFLICWNLTKIKKIELTKFNNCREYCMWIMDIHVYKTFFRTKLYLDLLNLMSEQSVIIHVSIGQI